jgi:hypothetical protein
MGGINYQHAVVAAIGDQQVTGQRPAEPGRHGAGWRRRRISGRRRQVDLEYGRDRPVAVVATDHHQPVGISGNAGVGKRMG